MKKIILAVSLIVFGAFGSTVFFSGNQAFADACSDKGKILTFKPWYDGLTDGSCNIQSPGSDTDKQAAFLWRIVLNVIDDLLQVVGYITVGYIMYGGFLMMTSIGSPDKAAHARKTILSAVIGLVVTLLSIAIVNLISSTIGL